MMRLASDNNEKTPKKGLRAREEEGKNEMKKPEVEDIRKSITKNANGVR
jgi:hypothetical protein